MTTPPDNSDNRGRCYCDRCPSNPEPARKLYCAAGKSDVYVNRKGCLCPGCPVYGQYGLNQLYYCKRGIAD